MTTRSIFQKICPGCMITLPLNARQCQCGYQFDHDEAESGLSSEEIRLKAEELYETYLAARHDQAKSAVLAAQSNFACDPSNQQKSRQVSDAIMEAEQTRAAYTAQAERVAEMRRSLPAVPRPAPPTMKPAPQQSIAPLPVELPPAVPTLPVPKRVAPPKPAAPVLLPTAKPHSKKIASRKPAPAPRVPRPSPVVVESASLPNQAFRRVQAAKAEKIVQAARLAEADAKTKRKNEVAALKASTPAPELPAPNLDKSPPRLMHANTKDCPNCTASVDSRAIRCRCGFEFPSESLIPSLAMSEEERAEFIKLFNFP